MTTATRFKDSLPSFYSNPSRKPPPLYIVKQLADEEEVETQQQEPPKLIQHTIITSPLQNPPRKSNQRVSNSRPSLSEQLASIGMAADSIVQSLRKDTPSSISTGVCFTLPTLRMVVGRLECKYPSPVVFFNQLCQYQFMHGNRDIAMHMYFVDMTSLTFDKRSLILSFKISHELDQFGADYDPKNRSHSIQIGLASLSDWEKARAFMTKKCRHRGAVS